MFCRIFLLLAFSIQILSAQGILDLQIQNLSTSDSTTTGSAGHTRQFSSILSGTPVLIDGDTASFSTHMQWYAGFHGTGGAAQTYRPRMDYRIDFTVFDPTNIGYTISIDAFLRGISHAVLESGGDLTTAASISHSPVYGFVDTDTTDGTATLGLTSLINGLTLSAAGATANLTNPSVRNNFDSSRSYVVGDFTGTRSFAVRFNTGSSNISMVLQNNYVGQLSVVAGLETDQTSLITTGLLLPGDPWNLGDLGHFSTISVQFNEVIPEPGTYALLAGGLVFSFVLVRRHFQNRKAKTSSII